MDPFVQSLSQAIGAAAPIFRLIDAVNYIKLTFQLIRIHSDWF